MARTTTTQTRSSIIDATSNTVVLAFDLADPRIPGLPGELSRTLHSPAVRSAIRNALVELALAKQRSATSMISDREASHFASALAGGVASAVGADLIDRVKQTIEFQTVEDSLRSLDTALKSSPLGVWVDRNANVLYVVGAGIAIGGAAALFATKTGGSLVDYPISGLTGRSMQVYNVGTFSLAGEMLCFQPRTHTIGAALTATQQLERLQVGVQLGIVATGHDVEQINGKLVMRSQDLNLSVIANSKPLEKTVSLGLGIEVTNHGLPGRLSIEVALGMRDKGRSIDGTTGEFRATKGRTGTFEVPRTGTSEIPKRTGTFEVPNEAKLVAKWSLSF
jgi:hypothetical protein